MNKIVKYIKDNYKGWAIRAYEVANITAIVISILINVLIHYIGELATWCIKKYKDWKNRPYYWLFLPKSDLFFLPFGQFYPLNL